MIKLDPEFIRKFNRFRSIRRGYYSFVVLVVLCILSLFLELLINKRALFVAYDGNWYFPTYGNIISGETFDLEYKYETNYRQLQQKFRTEGNGNFVIMPLVPFDPYEVDTWDNAYPPQAPHFSRRHFLGTDPIGRDILARLAYGFRIAIVFSFLIVLVSFVIGIVVGSLMGYYGGWVDLIGQRLIEVWVNVPFLYVIIIVSSIVVPSIWTLVGIMLFFRWTMMTWYMRTETLREKSREYVLAARSMGASTPRILIRHILPNSLPVVVTFAPFAIHDDIVALASLDFLGFGLAPPTPSWGELLSQGIEYLDNKWIITSIVTAMVTILTIITFIGEALREAFDPKKFTTYEG